MKVFSEAVQINECKACDRGRSRVPTYTSRRPREQNAEDVPACTATAKASQIIRANLAGQNCALLFKACLQRPDIDLSKIHAAAYRLCRRNSRRLSKGDTMRYKVEKVIMNRI